MDILTFFGQDPLIAAGMWLIVISVTILVVIDQSSPHMMIR